MPETTTSNEGVQNPAIEDSAQNTLFTPEQQKIVDKLVGEARVKARKQNENYEVYKQAYEELEALKESQKSDLEKANARAAKVESELKALKHEKEIAQLAAQVAKEKEVPASLLRGDTLEELETHADEILAAFQSKPSTPTLHSDGYKITKEPTHSTADSFANFWDEQMGN